MKHICDTMKDYIDAMNTSMQGDIIYCSEQLWNEIFKSQPERSKREDLKKCVICEYERSVKEIPNGVCVDCSEDSTFADLF